MIKDCGGSAFPFGRRTVMESVGSGTSAVRDIDKPISEGMTLRDYFAGQVLAGIIANQGPDGSEKLCAQWCYAQADAMLEARQA